MRRNVSEWVGEALYSPRPLASAKLAVKRFAPILRHPLQAKTTLAIHGGAAAIRHTLPPVYPGAMRIDNAEEEAVLKVIRSKRLFRYYGPHPGPSRVQGFESDFANHIGTSYAVAVSSGSAALVCGLAALGVGPGDEVIVPAYTWIASAQAVVSVGAVPVIAEIDSSLSLDMADVESKITKHTRAILPVHMRGAPCRMGPIMELARRRDLKVLEDVAQAAGGSFLGRRLGSIGDVGAFSFQFNKIITCGEGGAVVTDSADLHERILMYHDVVGGMRNQIAEEKMLAGQNFRMGELQGAIMQCQLQKLSRLLADMRQRKAALKGLMGEALSRRGMSFRVINDPDGDTATSIIFFAPSAERALRVAEALCAEGAPAFVLYDKNRADYHIYAHWSPIVKKRTWSERGGPWCWHDREMNYSADMCPRSLDLLSRAVHLDVSPDLTDRNIEELATAVVKVINGLA